MLFANSVLRKAAAVNTTDKLPFLHKLLIGEATFKDKVPVRYSHVEKVFGSTWQAELSDWAATNLDAEARSVLQRQINRLHLTRYTTRELAQYLAKGGVRNLEKNAEAAQLADARAYLAARGEEATREMIEAEAKLANWPKAMTEKFIKKVLKA